MRDVLDDLLKWWDAGETVAKKVEQTAGTVADKAEQAGDAVAEQAEQAGDAVADKAKQAPRPGRGKPAPRRANGGEGSQS